MTKEKKSMTNVFCVVVFVVVVSGHVIGGMGVEDDVEVEVEVEVESSVREFRCCGGISDLCSERNWERPLTPMFEGRD